ncbi:BBE domain-containing protein [Streptomyces sp. NPDC014764]
MPAFVQFQFPVPAYGVERYQRLTAAKKVYDPTNMFRVNHNIPPA